MLWSRVLLAFLPLISVSSGQTCGNVTHKDTPGPFYEENGLETHDIAPANELNKPDQMILEGRVTDKRCRNIEGATLEIWYAGGKNTEYTFPPSKLWYRGKTLTDKNGEYSFRATFPGTYDQRPIKHVHYKVTDNNMGKELVTQLYFRGYVPPRYEDYVKDRDTQFPNEIITTEVGIKVVFNVVME